MVSERRPCLRAFWDDRSLPAGVAGPWERCPLAREESILRWELIL